MPKKKLKEMTFDEFKKQYQNDQLALWSVLLLVVLMVVLGHFFVW